MSDALPIYETSCADRLKVLADDTRLAVLRQLLDGSKLVHELNASLQLEASLLSHHLKTLRDAGLVVSHRDGKAVRYELAPNVAVRAGGQAIDLGCCLLSFD